MMKKKLLGLLLDISLAASIVAAVWILCYVLPQKGIKAVPLEAVSQEARAAGNTTTGIETTSTEWQNTQNYAISGNHVVGAGIDKLQKNASNPVSGGLLGGQLQKTDIVRDETDWHEKFADKFTDTVVSTDTTYSSPNLSIELSYRQYDTGKLDTSSDGKHEKYGTRISYVLADIYVSDITCFQTAFAQDTYGVGYDEKLSDMSDRMKAVLSVNGDSYNNNRHKDNGTIIRNGVIYRNRATDVETCVLNWDGTVDIYPPGKIDENELIHKGAYQSWVFGPSLLDDNGKAKPSFITWDYICESHPRTALGYYEPGHYCLLLVDGRQKASRGMFLDEMAKVFEDLGCTSAYNLDGGHCSFMTFQGNVANHPYKPDHGVADGIMIKEM